MLLSWLRVAPVALLCLTACSFDQSGVGDGDAIDAAVADGPVVDTPDTAIAADADLTPDGPPSRPDANVPGDGPPPTTDAMLPDANCPGTVLSLTPSNFGKCDVLAPVADVSMSNGTYIVDTTNQTLRKQGDPGTTALNASVVPQPGGPDLLVWSVNSLVVGSTAVLTVRGTRPLAVVSFTSITIDGGLLANATKETPGPGGGGSGGGLVPGFCSTGTGAPGVVQVYMGNSGGSGGGGGGFGLVGGGGRRVAETGGGSIRADGGGANGTPELIPLRGGCGGGSGGNGGGAGGAGGGAIQLVASQTLSVGITARIVARGGGARGSAQAGTGGAGGGAGGGILLEAGTIALDGDVAANGGGGAEGTQGGGATWFGVDGDNGGNGDTAAAGGDGGGFGGNGGDGGHASTAAQDGEEGAADGDPPSGGGGGGGGVGRVRINTGSLSKGVTAVITPAETRG